MIHIYVPDNERRGKSDVLEVRRHHNQTATVLREWGADKLLIRGVNQGPREYDIIPKRWATEI